MQRLFVRSPILKIVYGILATLISIILVMLILVTEEVRMEDQTENWEGRAIENGAILFANNCSSCHGPDGKGLPGVAPALNSHYFFTDTGRMADVGWQGTIYDYVELTVAAGRPSKIGTQWAQIMPTWGSEYGGPFRGDQVQEVTAYVVNWRENALAQSPEEDPFQPFLDINKPVEHQNIETLIAIENGDPLPEVSEPDETGDSGMPRAPEDLWLSLGCSGCHNLEEDQTPDNRGPVGPHQGNLAERAADRVEGQSAEEYVYNSIVNPNAHIVEGYQANIMPANLAEKMSEEEIDALVEWLLAETSE